MIAGMWDLIVPFMQSNRRCQAMRPLQVRQEEVLFAKTMLRTYFQVFCALLFIAC